MFLYENIWWNVYFVIGVEIIHKNSLVKANIPDYVDYVLFNYWIRYSRFVHTNNSATCFQLLDVMRIDIYCNCSDEKSAWNLFAWGIFDFSAGWLLTSPYTHTPHKDISVRSNASQNKHSHRTLDGDTNRSPPLPPATLSMFNCILEFSSFRIQKGFRDAKIFRGASIPHNHLAQLWTSLPPVVIASLSLERRKLIPNSERWADSIVRLWTWEHSYPELVFSVYGIMLLLSCCASFWLPNWTDQVRENHPNSER